MTFDQYIWRTLRYDLALGHPVPAHVICHVISVARQPIEILSPSSVTHVALSVWTSGQQSTAPATIYCIGRNRKWSDIWSGCRWRVGIPWLLSRIPPQVHKSLFPLPTNYCINSPCVNTFLLIEGQFVIRELVNISGKWNATGGPI